MLPHVREGRREEGHSPVASHRIECYCSGTVITQVLIISTVAKFVCERVNEINECDWQVLPELVGGSADLTPSNNTWLDCSSDYQKDTPAGKSETRVINTSHAKSYICCLLLQSCLFFGEFTLHSHYHLHIHVHNRTLHPLRCARAWHGGSLQRYPGSRPDKQKS